MQKFYYVVELYVDELNECLIMRCSTCEGADHICGLLNEAFPEAVFDVWDSEPVLAMRDYDPERYQEIKNVLTSRPTRPQLIVTEGGKR